MAFKDTPEMMDVVKCESEFQQFDPAFPGKRVPYMGKHSPDVGVMQINKVHWPEAKALGLDIFNSVDDNIKMGQRILKKQGITAWVCYGL